jgi:hypothetical protein
LTRAKIKDNYWNKDMQKIQPEEIKDEEGDDSVSDGSSDHEDLEPMQVPTREAWVKEMGDYLADEEK